MFKNCCAFIVMLILSTPLLFAESVPKPSKEGLLWANPDVENMMEYYMCMQSHELYDLDWISDIKEYQQAHTRLKRTHIAYKYFIMHKLALQRANISKVRDWSSKYLGIGMLLSGSILCGYNYALPIAYGYTKHGLRKYTKRVNNLARAHERLLHPLEKLEELNDDYLQHSLSDDDILMYVDSTNLEDLKKEIKAEWSEKKEAEQKIIREKYQEEHKMPWAEMFKKAASLEDIKSINGLSILWAWSAGLGMIPSMQALCLPVLVHRWIGSSFYNTLEAPLQDVFESVEEDYAKHYFAMKEGNPQLLHEIQDKIYEFREGLGRASFFYKELVSTAVKLPLQKGEFMFDKEKFGQCYTFYPKKVKKVLANIMGRMCFFGSTNATPSTNFPLYFQGIPGSGKTYAENNITSVTGAPVSHITLDGGTIEEIIGTEYGKPGRLLTALTRGEKSGATNFSNGVLFIDEFDRLLSDSLSNASSKALLSFMLKMLDPSNRKFFSPYLNCYVDLPSTIILAGNYEIMDPALANRFQIVKFDGYTEELKWGIAREHLIPKIAEIYGFEEIDQEDLEAIYELVREDTEDAGVRGVELRVIKYFEEKRMEDFLQ